MKLIKFLAVTFVVTAFVSCKNTSQDTTLMIENSIKEISIPFEKHTLENGLTVLFHIDTSDPVVAVALTAHLGSARKREGKTGCTDLFEHLLQIKGAN